MVSCWPNGTALIPLILVVGAPNGPQFLEELIVDKINLFTWADSIKLIREMQLVETVVTPIDHLLLSLKHIRV